jgi:hypothetical protein
MDRKNKFAAETILKLRQSLDEVPPYEANELSKQQTIRVLSPQILALRSKGYGWMAIAAMPSERGLPVSVAALRTYLRRVREEATESKPQAQAKRSREVRAHTPASDRAPPFLNPPLPKSETPAAGRPLPPAATPRASTVAVPRATSPATRPEAEPRRPMFEVRPDTKDL